MSALFHSYLCGRNAAEWLIIMDVGTAQKGCSTCGQQIDPDSVFCTQCGTKTGGAVSLDSVPMQSQKDKFNGKQFSILGDSISTLEGYNPKGYNLFFTGETCQKAGVSDMNDTWWGQVISCCGGELLVNNSWSGSRVTKLPNRDSLFPSGCSDERTNGLHIGNIKPDVIIVYLGSNDWGYGVEVTNRDYAMWSSVFETAYSKMLEKLKVNYPHAEIFCCTLCSTYMSGKPSFVFPENYGGINIEKYNAVIRNAAESKNCNVIDLYKYHLPYDSIDGSHPNLDGMHTLAALMLREMFPDIEYTVLEPKDMCQNSNGTRADLNNHQNLPKHKGLFGKLFGGK